jgi:phenylalanine-4-hydroxylase
MFAALYQAAGQASRRATTAAALEFFSRVFWFTLEFGVLWESGELRTYGAGLLSSFGELEVFREAQTRPLDIAKMGTLDYDITHYQPVLFAGASFNEIVDVVGAFFESFDDELAQKYLEPAR